MDIAAVAILLGIIAAVFVVGGLVWAFVADRRRNEDVAHDPERLDQPDLPGEPGQPGIPGHHDPHGQHRQHG